MLRRIRPPRRWALASLVSGGLTALAFPPWGLWPLVLVGLTPVLMAARELSPGRAAACGWLWGLALSVVQLYWLLVVMTQYGYVHWSLAGLGLLALGAFLGCYPGIFALLLALVVRAGVWTFLAAPFIWAGTEWLRGHALTGFPWLPLGNGLIPALPLIQSAEIWGATGLSALVVLINALILPAGRALPSRRRPRGAALMGLAASALILLGGWWWGSARLDQVDQAAAGAPTLPITVVQGDVTIKEIWDPQLKSEIIERHVKLTEAAAQGVERRPWLAVWSESAAPFYFMAKRELTAPVLAMARHLDAYVILGTSGTAQVGDKLQPTNRSWLVGPDGSSAGFYDKVHLVPFGEYVPFGSVLSFVRAIAVLGLDFAPGDAGSVLQAGPATLGPLICYESIFPELARAQRIRGAEVIINQTNDAWFGPTGASRQHMSHLVLRCVENRMACARSANTGISGFVGPGGRIHQATAIFTRAVATRAVPLLRMETTFTRHGDILGPGGLVAALLAGGWALWRGRLRRED